MSVIDFSKEFFKNWKERFNSISLDSILKKLKVTDNLQTKLKVLFTLESDVIPIEDLTNKLLIQTFLNTLYESGSDFSSDVYENYAYFLLRYATFRPNNPNYDTLQTVITNFDSIKTEKESTMNKAVKNNIKIFINMYKNAISQKTVFQVSENIKTFICIEELLQELYMIYWQQLPNEIISFSQLIRNCKQSSLEIWLFSTYINENNIPLDQSNLPELYSKNLTKVSEDVIQDFKDMFKTPPEAFTTRTSLPISKKMASKILQNITQEKINTRIIPILGPTEAILSSLNEKMLFFYDFIIESIFSNYVYSVPTEVVETFLSKSTLTIENYLIEIYDVIGKVSSFNIDIIKSLYKILVSLGLSKDNTLTYMTIIHNIYIKHNNFQSSWTNFTKFSLLFSQIIIFAFYFFQLISYASPTSQFFNIYTYALSRLSAEISSVNQSLHINIENSSSWPTLSQFPFFIVKVPISEFNDISKNIKSNTMQMMLWIYVQRTWQFKNIKVFQDVAHTPETKIYSREDVIKYCKNINIGQTTYDKTIVRSTFFASNFIKLKILPTFKEIMTNELPKNKSLHLLKWLIIFAAEETPTLFLIRRALIVFYFNILDILESPRESGNLFLDLLTSTDELIKELQNSTDEKLTISVEFLSFLYTLHYTPIANRHHMAMQQYILKTEELVQNILPFLKVSHTLCSCNIHYIPFTETLELPVSQEIGNIIITIESFKTVINELYKKCENMLNTFAEYVSAFRAVYIEHINILNQIKHIKSHPLKIISGNPDMMDLNNDFITCLANIYSVKSSIKESSCYIIHQHFDALFKEPLITTDKIKSVMSLKYDESNPDDLMTSLEKNSDFFPPFNLQGKIKPNVTLTIKELEFLKEQFNINNISGERKANVNKIPYSSLMDLTKEQISISDFNHLYFETTVSENHFLLLDKQDFLANLSL